MSIAFVLLALAFSAVQPASSASLSGLERWVFWLLHGLVAIPVFVAASWLTGSKPLMHSINPWFATLITGLCGALMYGPASMSLDWVFQVSDEGSAGFAAQLLDETSAVLAPVTLSWVLINAPRILRLGARVGGPDQPVEGEQDATGDAAREFFSLIPRALGQDLISLQSDLHYLHVTTFKGKTMILCNMKDAVEELGDSGMQVHRSYWVANAHVRRLTRSGGQLFCVMSNDQRVPVSRRRRAEVVEKFGYESRLAQRP